jgi:hypothetical protein
MVACVLLSVPATIPLFPTMPTPYHKAVMGRCLGLGQTPCMYARASDHRSVANHRARLRRQRCALVEAMKHKHTRTLPHVGKGETGLAQSAWQFATGRATGNHFRRRNWMGFTQPHATRGQRVLSVPCCTVTGLVSAYFLKSIWNYASLSLRGLSLPKEPRPSRYEQNPVPADIRATKTLLAT